MARIGRGLTLSLALAIQNLPMAMRRNRKRTSGPPRRTWRKASQQGVRLYSTRMARAGSWLSAAGFTTAEWASTAIVGVLLGTGLAFIPFSWGSTAGGDRLETGQGAAATAQQKWAVVDMDTGRPAPISISDGRARDVNENPRPLGSGPFGLCHTGGGTNCVVDGDTIWMNGVKIRVADIDAPETHPSRCAIEADLGGRATLRMQQLLNAGPFELVRIERDEDRYGRKLRTLVRQGRSLGEILVSEGLARPYEGGVRSGWC